MPSKFMSMTIALVLIIPLIGVWLALPQERVHACSCGRISLSGELDRSDVVFMGRAISVRENPDAEWFSDRLTTEFYVDTVWKGPANQTIHINSGAHFDSCGFPFTKGEEYIVYASYSDWSVGLSTSYCSRTTSLSWAKATAELAALGEGQSPPPSIAERFLYGVIGLSLIGLAGMLWLAWRTRRVG